MEAAARRIALGPRPRYEMSLQERLLLARLRARDEDAFSEIVRRYGDQIYRWCRRWHLQEADAEDVTQGVLARLARTLKKFEYDPARSFRAYLKTVTKYALTDFAGDRQGPGVGSGDTGVLEVLHSVEAREDLVGRLNESFDRELYEEAVARVRGRVEGRTWEAFRLTAQEGQRGADVGRQLGMQVAAVFKARSKVQRMLRDELARLESD